MLVTGVDYGGKTVSLSPGLRIHIPYGAVYAKDKDGDYDIFKPLYTPPGYKAGYFQIDDEVETSWKISGLHDTGSIEYPNDKPLSPEEKQKLLREGMVNVGVHMTREDEDAKKPYVPGSSTHVEETEDGFTIHSTITASEAGGKY